MIIPLPHKIQWFCLAVLFPLVFSFLFISCASQQYALSEDVADTPSDALEPVLQEVKLLYAAAEYQQAADILRSIGRREYSYYRMDEVLYWLGKCNLLLRAPDKAVRCFELLRKYYPRSSSVFEDLADKEQISGKMLTLMRGRKLLAANHKGEDTVKVQKYAGPLVSNSFYETDIRQALMDLSAQSGITIIPDAMVRGYITLDLIDLPLEQALNLMLAPLGYSYRKVENCYIVGAPVSDNPSFPLLAQTEKIKPKHLPAAEVPKLISDFYKNYLKVDANSNTLTIAASPEIISRFKEELAAIDHPPQQIMIEAVVVEMGDEARRSLGLDWDWTGTKANNGFQVSKLVPNMTDSSYFLGEFTKTEEYYKGMVFDLRAALRALAIKNKANIRANPRVATLDGRQATIRIGREAYYSILQGSTLYSYATLEKITTGILLKFTPYVGSGADITTDIIVEVSDVTGSGVTNLPVTSVRSVETRVQVANGQTIGIGGLVSENRSEEKNRIPFLGDIPFLGYLFGTTTTVKKETEVVVLITPHLLINPREFDNL